MDYYFYHHRSLSPSHVHSPPNPETIGKHRRRHNNYIIGTSPDESPYRLAAERPADTFVHSQFGLEISYGERPAQWAEFEVKKGLSYPESGNV